MQAIIRAGGKQYLVSLGQTLEIDLVPDAAKTLELPVLLVIDGDKVTVGTPEVAGVAAQAEVVGEVKGEKLQVLKFKAKKRVNKRIGHRQHYTQIKIVAIGATKAETKPAMRAKPKPKLKPVAAAAK